MPNNTMDRLEGTVAGQLQRLVRQRTSRLVGKYAGGTQTRTRKIRKGSRNSAERNKLSDSAAQVAKDHRATAVISAAKATSKLAGNRRYAGRYS
jgi:hypothetical protein